MRLMILALAASSAAFAVTPDLSGTWKLNTEKSEFGQFPPPSSMIMKVTHADPKLTFEIRMAGDMGEMTFTTNCTTDGKECTNQAFGGSETKSVAKWDGETLVVDTKGSFGDNNFTMKDKWTLSEGSKVLTILRHWSGGMGEMDQKMTLEKQYGAAEGLTWLAPIRAWLFLRTGPRASIAGWPRIGGDGEHCSQPYSHPL